MKISRLCLETLKLDIRNSEGRRTGKTTSEVLATIALAMGHPGVTYKFIDSAVTSHQTSRSQVLTALSILDKLGLKYFTIDTQAATIRYDILIDLVEIY